MSEREGGAHPDRTCTVSSHRLLLIDNYDSFTFKLAQALQVLGADVRVYRNDQLSVSSAIQLKPTHLCISPGPGRPKDSGISKDMITYFEGRIPILGVCLGHQCIAEVFGGRVEHAKRLMHGKDSLIQHDGKGLYQGLPNPFPAGRYHSLSIPDDGVPDGFVVDAQTEEGEVMGIHHLDRPIMGVQFHPESILTPDGGRLLQNFLNTGDGSNVAPV